MLIQITNRCHEGCPHCMQDSTPDGGMMDLSTMANIIRKFLAPPMVCVSGGEPTEHPFLYEMCKMLDDAGWDFSICTNGLFMKDREKVDTMRKVLKMRHCTAVQVYTHKDFYKDYPYVSRLKFKNRNIFLDTSDIVGMQDLGRAKDCPTAQEYIARHRHYMSCLNGALTARQSENMAHFITNTARVGLLCKPLIDFNGNVHLSESWLCPSCGNVNTDTTETIFVKMKAFSPCGGCRLCRRFIEDSATMPKLSLARMILGL